ncbi:MAG: YCF48-related protein [Desulfobacterota bacterium]|nr:YCF48-related protein [Thermodesulfobacteriota bacterium]
MKIPDIKMVTSENITAVSAPDENHVWIAGDYGVIFHSSDGGTTWREQRSGVDVMLCDIQFIDTKTGWIVGGQGTLLATTDGGTTWIRYDTGVMRHLLSLSFVDTQYGWVVGEFATILYTQDGGKTWQTLGEQSDLLYNRVCFVDRMTGWIVGEAGLILHTTDGGRTWNQQMPEFFKRDNLEDEYDRPRPTLFGLSFTDAQNGWICGMDSTIMRTRDGGATWELVPTQRGEPLYTICIKGGRSWCVGNKGTYLLSRDGGEGWQRMEEAITTKVLFADVDFSNDRTGWIVGSSGLIVKTTDGGESWNFCSGMSYLFEGFSMPEGLEKRIIE